MLGGLAHPEGTRKQLHHHATQAGMQLSVQGLDQRFSAKSVTFMRHLLEAAMSQMVRSETQDCVLPSFKGVYITDCTRLVWEKFGVKLGVRFELQRGQLQACLMDLKQNDQRASVIENPLPKGALHLNDLGFFKLKRLQQWSQQGVYWLVRYKVGTGLYDAEGKRLDIKALLTGKDGFHLRVGVGHDQERQWVELCAAPLSGEALTKRQARLKEQVRLDQRPLITTAARCGCLDDLRILRSHIAQLHSAFRQLSRFRSFFITLFTIWLSPRPVPSVANVLLLPPLA